MDLIELSKIKVGLFPYSKLLLFVILYVDIF